MFQTILSAKQRRVSQGAFDLIEQLARSKNMCGSPDQQPTALMLVVFSSLLLGAAANTAVGEIWVPLPPAGSLHDAVTAAARHPGPATIHLAPGRHALAETLVLDARHSGTRFVGTYYFLFQIEVSRFYFDSKFILYFICIRMHFVIF